MKNAINRALVAKKKLSFILSFLALTICANGQNQTWVRELENKNPLKGNSKYISVYFRFDTIVNNFEVSGILYPHYSPKGGWSNENGVRLFFHSLKTGKNYTWTDWDDKCQCFKMYFMSKNVMDIISNREFSGFKNGDAYIFKYDSRQWLVKANELLPYAEYQFYDVDFDGEDELILGFYEGGSHGGSSYEIYDITDSALEEKRPIDDPNYFSLDANTVLDAQNKTITNYQLEGRNRWETYGYTVDNEGEIHSSFYADCFYDPVENVILSDTTYYQ